VRPSINLSRGNCPKILYRPRSAERLTRVRYRERIMVFL
jgi:hypothetical protein